MNKVYLYLIKSLIVFTPFFSLTARGAPIPATSSSQLVGIDVGQFISEYGFSLNSAGTSWIQSEPPRGMPSMAILYRSPKATHGVQASLTVRADKLKGQTSLEKYVHQWIKDYPRLGFEVLASKSLKVAGQDAHVLDVLSREANKQLRQIVFFKNQVAVVITCRDHRDTFEDTVKTCNDITRSFRWMNL